jgi:hypothetical protein
MSLLENMTYLSESESAYYPAMVPVVENTTIGANVIRLEDMVQFAESNGIIDFGAALQAVCEASQISPSSVAFSVQEENVIADQGMTQLVSGIMNEGVAVVAVPISGNDVMMQLAEMAINESLADDDTLLEAFANQDWDIFAEEAAAAADPKKAEDSSITDTIKEKLQWIKEHAYNQPKEWLAKQIAALNAWSQKIQGQVANTSSAKRSIFQKVLNKIASVIEFLTRKLHNFMSDTEAIKKGTKSGMRDLGAKMTAKTDRKVTKTINTPKYY